MFSAYMQEVNLNIFYFFLNYFTYVSVSGLMYAQESSASRFVELCLSMVLLETSSYFTRTTYFLKTSLAIFLQMARSSHATFQLRRRHELRLTKPC